MREWLKGNCSLVLDEKVLSSLNIALRCPAAVEAAWAADFRSGGASIGIVTRTSDLRDQDSRDGFISQHSSCICIFVKIFPYVPRWHDLRWSFGYGVLVHKTVWHSA